MQELTFFLFQIANDFILFFTGFASRQLMCKTDLL